MCDLPVRHKIRSLEIRQLHRDVRIVQDLPVCCDNGLLEFGQRLPFNGKVARFAQRNEAVRLNRYGLVVFGSKRKADFEGIALR